MKVLEGKSVFGGIAIGKISFLEQGESLVKRVRIENVKAEQERFEAAREKAKTEG